MEAGASRMQFKAGVAPELIDVIQALILFFVAAPSSFAGAANAEQLRTAQLGGWVGHGTDKTNALCRSGTNRCYEWTSTRPMAHRHSGTPGLPERQLCWPWVLCVNDWRTSGVVNIGIEGQFLLLPCGVHDCANDGFVVS